MSSSRAPLHTPPTPTPSTSEPPETPTHGGVETTGAARLDAPSAIELSVVMPCLNEADTLATCIDKARRAMTEAGIDGEVVVADNGSIDASVEIAKRHGARVVHVAERGYGQALMSGIAAARGRFVIMGDADDSYDFTEVPTFYQALRDGHDLVQGCRLPAGGGTVLPGAMPFLHRWWGNPLFSFMVRRMFGAPIRDVYCGLRGFTKSMYERLDMRCTGMEFATEMVIKASLRGERIAEVPITLHPDGRTSHAPHLRTFRDGWRTLRFFLLCSPRWLFLIPGVALVALGLLCYAMVYGGIGIGSIRFDAHTLLFGSLFLSFGYQSILFAILSKTFAGAEGILPLDQRITTFYRIFKLERVLLLATGALGLGLGCLAVAIHQWWQAGFGALDYARTMRWVIPGVTLATLGFQSILFGFFASILGMRRT